MSSFQDSGVDGWWASDACGSPVTFLINLAAVFVILGVAIIGFRSRKTARGAKWLRRLLIILLCYMVLESLGACWRWLDDMYSLASGGR